MTMETCHNAAPYCGYTPLNPRKKWMVLIMSIVGFIVCMTFASIYGLDYEGLREEEEMKEPMFADVRNLSTYTEEKSCGRRDEVANVTIWNDVVNKTSSLVEDMFT
jgi:hypothetical protein